MLDVFGLFSVPTLYVLIGISVLLIVAIIQISRINWKNYQAQDITGPNMYLQLQKQLSSTGLLQ